jgi:hypothetical protein
VTAISAPVHPHACGEHSSANQLRLQSFLNY